MRRRLLIVVLALGTVLGFASGFAHLRGRRHAGHVHAWCEGEHRPRGSPAPATP
jgi:hypothetical protein